jgi:aspartate/methionine/tyrosine aminotransferase
MSPNFAQRTTEMQPLLAMEVMERAFEMERAKVGATPGVDFGESGEGWLRFAYANSEAAIEAARERPAAAIPRPQ